MSIRRVGGTLRQVGLLLCAPYRFGSAAACGIPDGFTKGNELPDGGCRTTLLRDAEVSPGPIIQCFGPVLVRRVRRPRPRFTDQPNLASRGSM